MKPSAALIFLFFVAGILGSSQAEEILAPASVSPGSALAQEKSKETPTSEESDTESEKDSLLLDDAEEADLEESSEVPSAIDLSQFIETHPAESMPWTAPNYSSQLNALGYSESAFKTPKGFESRVAFWTQIYTRYTSQQGLIHDTKHLHVIYDSVDFGSINLNPELTEKQKKKARHNLIKDKKQRIQKILAQLQKAKSADGLSGEELKIWNLFEKIPEKTKWVEAQNKARLRFQLGQSDRFLQGLYYSGRYMRAMEKIFVEENLPLELTRLPFVESSFNILARSKVGASGIWQFMKSTARLYKLKMTAIFDERNDPLRATVAAARVLKGNYQLLGHWPLALTAYNHGPSGVRRAVQQAQSPQIEIVVEKAKSRRFGFASENFYACFLAVLEVEKNAAKYFKNPMVSKPMSSEVHSIKKAISYAQFLNVFGGDNLKAQLYNPHLNARSRKARGILSVGTHVHVPTEAKATFEDLFKNQLTK